MNKNIPRYLKLLTSPEATELEIPSPAQELARAVEMATGWRIDGEPQAPSSSEQLRLGAPAGRPSQTDEPSARRLVDRLNQLLRELQAAQQTLWEREAELAAAPMQDLESAPRGDEHLAHRLQAILEGASSATECQSAAIYMLDDETSQLKLRASFGLPASRYEFPARNLRGAVADLEALIGHAVVLEDATSLENWRCPESCKAAICVPIATNTTPLGTMWLFCEENRQFEPTHSYIAELTAGRIAVELERERLVQEQWAAKKLAREVDYAAGWQQDRLPRLSPLVDGWKLAGWNAQAHGIGGDFYDWCVLPDGRIAASLGDAEGEALDAAFTSASLASALKAHASYQHDARDMLNRINDTFWGSTAGDEFAALAYVLIDPITGRCEYCVSGDIDVFQVGPTAPALRYRSLPKLGTQPELKAQHHDTIVAPGSALVLLSHGVRRSLESANRPQPLARLKSLALEQRWQSAKELADIYRTHLLAEASPLSDDCTVLVLHNVG